MLRDRQPARISLVHDGAAARDFSAAEIQVYFVVKVRCSVVLVVTLVAASEGLLSASAFSAKEVPRT